MLKGEAKRLSRGGKPSSTGSLLGGLVISIVLAFAAGIQLVNRCVLFETEERDDKQLTVIRTPFGILPSVRAQHGPRTLWEALYPGSQWDEQKSYIFYGGAAGAEKKMAQLTVLIFTTAASLPQTDAWYRKRLGDGFIQSKGWYLGKADEPEWAHLVQGAGDPETLEYRRSLPGHTQGVLLESTADGVSVTLYDFQQSES
jgi:hypothetical protein